jgi:hypothetical protein
VTWFARGLGAARLGEVAAANESATALQQIRERLWGHGLRWQKVKKRKRYGR